MSLKEHWSIGTFPAEDNDLKEKSIDKVFLKSDVDFHVERLKKKMDTYRLDNRLWKLKSDILLSEFLELIEEEFE